MECLKCNLNALNTIWVIQIHYCVSNEVWMFQINFFHFLCLKYIVCSFNNSSRPGFWDSATLRGAGKILRRLETFRKPSGHFSGRPWEATEKWTRGFLRFPSRISIFPAPNNFVWGSKHWSGYIFLDLFTKIRLIFEVLKTRRQITFLINAYFK